MFKNYLILTLRSLVKNKVFAAINIIGLAIALASTFFILVYVVNEFTYDDCHLKNERIYKVINRKLDFDVKIANTPYIFSPTVKNRFPGIEKITRTQYLRGVEVNFKGELIKQNDFLTADSDIFEIFTLPIIIGTNDIKEKNSIVISESIAQKYFGNENPINKTLEIRARKVKYLLKVIGVMKDLPQNSTLKAEIIGNIQLNLEQLQARITYTDIESDWFANFWTTYILLKKNGNVKHLETGFRKIVDEFYPKDIDSKEEYILQNLKDVYFDKELIAERHGNLDDVYLYIIIGFVILLFAVGNYTILSAAISNNRAKEIGIRKTVGATKKNLVFQFLGESIILTFFALLLSLLLVKVSYSFAQNLFDYDFNIIKANYIHYTLFFLLLTSIIGIFSGLYVAVFLSSLNVTEIIKNNLILKNKWKVRKILMLVQFVAFIILVLSTIVIYKQHNYFINKDLGFKAKNLLFIHANFRNEPWLKSYMDKIYTYSSIESVTASMDVLPTNSISDVLEKKFDDSEQQIPVEVLGVGNNFIKTYGIELIEGVDITDKYVIKNQYKIFEEIIVNETALKELGINDPIGEKIGDKRIVGVCKDFNLHSLHSKIPPLEITFVETKYLGTITVKYKKGTFDETVSILKDEWSKFSYETPFEFSTIEENIKNLYEEELTLFNIVSFFTVLTILLSASGLFGLTLFTLKQRTKEIGIRRVLGASFNNIIFILTKEFIALTIISNIIALPIGYYLINIWLQDFSYRIVIGVLPFVISIIIVLVIGLGAISIQASKAILVNPIDSLRNE